MSRDWSNRLYEVINEMPLDEDKLLELLKEDWNVEEYRDAVGDMGSTGVCLKSGHEGWKRMELVNSHIICFLKTGKLD
jgi:hypothetical protein